MNKPNCSAPILLIALAALLATPACSDDPSTSLDPADAAVADQGATDSSAPADGSADAGNADANIVRDAAVIDAGPGNQSVVGTSLEGVQIQWSDTLELCSSWREGQSIDNELGNKAHVSLRPSSRPSLGSGDLSNSKLGGGSVRRSPLSAGIRDLGELDPVGNLVRYELRDPAGDSSLGAEIEYDVPGAGILVEIFEVYRARGVTPAPVIAGDDNYEHHFYLYTPGGHDGVMLERCGGPTILEPAVHVLVGHHAGHSVTITRFLRSLDALAGSFPVNLSGVIVHDSARPYERAAGFGYWNQTYAAMHHNWDETSRIDFTRDLGLYHSVFAPYWASGIQNLPSVISQINMSGVNGFGSAPSFTVETLDLSTGTTSSETFDVPRFWANVDSRNLRRQLQVSCPSGDVVTLRDFGLGYAFQVSTCPRAQAPGFSLASLVPVGFDAAPDAVGVAIPGSAFSELTVDGRPGFTTVIAGNRLTISKDTQYFFVRVDDAQNQPLTEFLAEPSTLEETPQDSLLTMSNPSRAVRVQLVRRWAGQGVGESAIYAPVRFELELNGTRHQIDAWDRLSYSNSHHNWADQLVAKGDGLTITWRVRFENGPLVYSVRVLRDADGVELLAETDLVSE